MNQKTVEMANLERKDPVLRAFVSLAQPKTDDANVNRANMWVTLKTNTFSLKNMDWTTPRELKNNKPDNLSFLLIKKFDASSSILIYNALNSTQSPDSLPRITIDNNGDVTVGGREVGKNGITKYSRTDGRSRTPVSISSDIDPDYIKNNMISWSTTYYMSTNSKYIIVNTNDKVPDYVMVLNPLHTYNFKKYYRNAIINKNVKRSGVFENSQLHEAVVKYCNALVVPGRFNIRYHSGVSGQKPDVYLDPVCGALVDNNTARLNRFYVTNVTSWYYRNKFYVDNAIGKKFIDHIEQISESRELNRSFTCQDYWSATSGPVTLYTLLSGLNQMSVNSETFLYDLAIFTNTPDATKTSVNDFDVSRIPQCSPKTDIKVCEINIYASGDVMNNNISSCTPNALTDVKKQLDAIGGNAIISTGGVEESESKGEKDKENSYKYIIIGLVILVVIIILGFILFGTSSSVVPAAVPASVPVVSNITAAFGKLFN
jgi:hypothetical protein